MNAAQRMPLHEAVAIVHRTRRDDDVVISSMGNAREWMALGPLHARDLVLVPSAMGHATSMALGLALAQPQRRIIALSGDGSLLMNLGTLVTIGAHAPPNLVVIVYDNGVYEVTGSQPTPGSADGRTDNKNVDFIAMARAAGLTSVFRYSTIDEWTRGIDHAFGATGPVFILLDVEPAIGKPGPKSPGPAAKRAIALRAVLAQPSASA